jgi:hypothetical protein
VKVAPPAAKHTLRNINGHTDIHQKLSDAKPFTAKVRPSAVLFLRLRPVLAGHREGERRTKEK